MHGALANRLQRRTDFKTQNAESPTEYALRTEYACVQSSLNVREKVRIYHYSTQTEDLTI